MIRTINGGKLKYPMFVRNICDSSTMRLSDRTREQEDIVCTNPSSHLIYIFLKRQGNDRSKKENASYNFISWMCMASTP
jgi:hypothetical protein